MYHISHPLYSSTDWYGQTRPAEKQDISPNTSTLNLHIQYSD